MNNGNYIEYLRQGGVAIYPLAVCSIVSVAIIIERSFYLLRQGKKLKKLSCEVLQCAGNKDLRGALGASQSDALGLVYETIIANRSKSSEEINAIAERRRIETIANFKKYIWILGTVGSLAPFIGLFGTVTGIIDSFRSIAVSGSGGFTVVSAGISEALIATAAGLIVAVYSVFAYNFFTTKIGSLALFIKLRSEDFIDAVKGIEGK